MSSKKGQGIIEKSGYSTGLIYNLTMFAPVLATKFYIPSLRPEVILRPRLVERLNEGLALGRKLSLISASAGFGKTTLVSEWVRDCAMPVAWLSLDEGDNDPVRFLNYLVAALQTLPLKPGGTGVGAGALAVLQSPQPPPAEFVLTSLLNDVASIPGNFVLVLDDYHLIDSRPVDAALTFLIEHSPPQMHLVITTREDPPFPLSRLRVRGQMTELRTADLRFTPAEAAEFLNRVMGWWRCLLSAWALSCITPCSFNPGSFPGGCRASASSRSS